VVNASSMLNLLQGYLQATSERQQLITANMANIDTPGYKTRDLDFEKALQQATADTGALQFAPVMNEVQGLPERADGNNVNLDRESVVLSETQLQFQLGVQLVKDQFSRLLTAIKDGN
jgi:flagellar basal-body rod protein FlgB